MGSDELPGSGASGTHAESYGSHPEGSRDLLRERPLSIRQPRRAPGRSYPGTGLLSASIYCDGHSLCYDSKRDCLWLANEKTLIRYDLGTGTAVKVEVKKPQALGQFLFWGEEVYLPGADLILLMNLFKGSDGKLRNVVWDPNDSKFYWASLTFVENGKLVEFKQPPFSWSDALNYDPKLNLLVLNNSSARKVWLMKFDRKTANLEEIKDE